MRILLISLFFSFCSWGKCQNWDISYFYNGKKITNKDFFCLELRPIKASSRTCQQLKTCPTYQKLISISEKKLQKNISTVGSLGFELCYKIKGHPSIFKVKLGKKKWQTISKCQIGSDFIDTSTLMLWFKEIQSHYKS